MRVSQNYGEKIQSSLCCFQAGGLLSGFCRISSCSSGQDLERLPHFLLIKSRIDLYCCFISRETESTRQSRHPDARPTLPWSDAFIVVPRTSAVMSLLFGPITNGGTLITQPSFGLLSLQLWNQHPVQVWRLTPAPLLGFRVAHAGPSCLT